jgi:hypothetical protein
MPSGQGTVQFWKTHHAVHISSARPVACGCLPEAPSIMNREQTIKNVSRFTQKIKMEELK